MRRAGARLSIEEAECFAPEVPDAVDEAPQEVREGLEGRCALTDVDAGELFAEHHGDRLRCCHAVDGNSPTSGRWLCFDRRRWRFDDSGEAMRCAKATAAAISAAFLGERESLLEQAEGAAGEERKELKQRAKAAGASAVSMGQMKRIRPMMDAAKSSPGMPVRIDELDRDPMLLTCANGTVNLESGARYDHDPADLVTRMAPVNWNPAATCPTFERFLGDIFSGNEGLIAYVQRAAGYSLTGDTSEQNLFMAYGSGANGKSTLIEALSYVVGEYAEVADFATLLDSHSDRHPTDLAKLRGARLVSASEPDPRKALAEGKVKQMTGGDRITARFMHRDFFTYKPHFKLWLMCNKRPRIKGTDDGIWRRIHLIPFTVQIPTEKRDKALLSKLKAEADGIFAWMLRGCLLWQEKGLCPPSEVVDATQAYRQDSDSLARWLEDRCEVGEALTAPSGDLLRSFNAWAEEEGERPWTSQALGRELTQKGFASTKAAGKRVRSGLGLKQSGFDGPPAPGEATASRNRPH